MRSSIRCSVPRIRGSSVPPLAVAAILLSASAWADGDNVHGTSYSNVLPGGGVVSEGLGFSQRFSAQPVGYLTIAGIPGDAEVVSAFLYWTVLGGYDDSVVINGVEYLGDLIGTTQDTCWGWGDNHAYRAQVRSTVTANGTYEVSGFDYTPGVVDSQGFSLVVVYRVLTSDVLTQVTINDGAVYVPSSPAVASSMSFDPLGSPLLMVRAHYAVGDAQGADDGTLLFNGAPIATDNWEGDGCFSPGGCPSPDPGGDGAMWDDDTFDLGPLALVSPGDTGVVSELGSGSDCLVWAAFIFEASWPNPCPDQDNDGVSTCDGDCDDLDPARRPGGTEVLDGVDNDCNGLTDDLPADDDGDGYTVNEGDCNDSLPFVNPGATEWCDNGQDEDCDGQIDEQPCDPVPEGDDDTSAADDDSADDDDDGGSGGSGRSGCGCAAAPDRGPGFAAAAFLLLALRRRSRILA